MRDPRQAGRCYAEHGYLGHSIWTGLDRVEPGAKISGCIPVYSQADLLDIVRALPCGTLWRHDQAGDFTSQDTLTIDRDALQPLIEANRGRRESSQHFRASFDPIAAGTIYCGAPRSMSTNLAQLPYKQLAVECRNGAFIANRQVRHAHCVAPPRP